MSRKTGFDRDTYNEYKRLKSLGLSDRQVAEQWGWSRSTLYNAKTGRTKRISARSQQRATRPKPDAQAYDARVGIDVAQDISRITYEELQRLATTGRDTRTRRLAMDALNDLDASGLSIEELRTQTFTRPVFYRTIRGKRVRLLLGRTKGEEGQEIIRRQLKAKGLTFTGNTYIDFGGYGGVN